uniref:Uncharacterized protein n=1 Tax=Physcomitrium patens TaxID=3218 RepID=A0A2K1J861_PHYPA|nr:hypothetical protein PHYPA_020822 [Physcomitrium patens]
MQMDSTSKCFRHTNSVSVSQCTSPETPAVKDENLRSSTTKRIRITSKNISAEIIHSRRV